MRAPLCLGEKGCHAGGQKIQTLLRAAATAFDLKLGVYYEGHGLGDARRTKPPGKLLPSTRSVGSGMLVR